MARVKKPTNALGVLVDQVCEANGWSRRDLARRAEDRGFELSHQRVSQMCTEIPLGSIQADKIFGLAAALAVSPTRVALAVMEAMGFSVSDASPSPAEVIMRDAELSADTKAALLSILRGQEERRRGA